MITITVPFDPMRLSLNQRLHWRARAKLSKLAHQAARVAWICAGSPVIDGPVDVSLIIRRARPIDPINALSGWKSCEDGLFNRRRRGYGVVEDDSAEFVRYAPVVFETGKQWKGREEIVVRVTPRATA